MSKEEIKLHESWGKKRKPNAMNEHYEHAYFHGASDFQKQAVGRLEKANKNSNIYGGSYGIGYMDAMIEAIEIIKNLKA